MLQGLTGNKVGELPSGIQDARDAFEVTLFADAIAGGGCEPRGVNNVRSFGIFEMAGGRAVTAAAPNCEMGKRDGCVPIFHTGDEIGFARMTEETFVGDRAREIGIREIFVSGGEAISPAVSIPGDRRLEEVVIEHGYITIGMGA